MVRNWKLGIKMKRVYELEIYKLAEELSDMIWYDFDTWNKKAQRTIGYQIIKSSDSIAVNIAEGYGRYTPADRKNLYLYSRGSFEETKSWLRKPIRRKVISDSKAQKYKLLIDKLGPKLAPAALGFITLFFGIGQAAGPGVAGAIADAAGSFVPAFVLAGSIAFLGAVASLFYRES